MSTELVKIGDDFAKIKGYIVELVGNPDAPTPIKDEATLKTVTDNMIDLKGLKTAVTDYFKPKKAEAKKPYEAMLEAEKKWLEPIEKAIDFVNVRVKEWNEKMREELRKKEQAEAELRAKAERDRLEAEKASAQAVGNTEQAAALEVAAKSVEVDYVPERKLKTQTGFATQSEKEVIEDMQITNHAEFAAALVGAGLSSLIVLDKKTETAFKKYLLTNARDCNKFPGVLFRRDFDTTFRKTKAS